MIPICTEFWCILKIVPGLREMSHRARGVSGNGGDSSLVLPCAPGEQGLKNLV